MKLSFAKMHGLGNDFVVIDGVRQAVSLDGELTRRLADRHLGIGCDQVLLVEPSGRPGLDFRYRIFNADGSEVAQCGNGARCFARFVREQGLSAKDHLRVETAAGELELYHLGGGDVRVDMGVPRFEPDRVPLRVDEQAARYRLDLAGETVEFGAVSMGNPHMVMEVETVNGAEVQRLGPRLESHPLFPERVNVGFCEFVHRASLRLRVFERGSGETLACGSGACAAVAVGRLWGRLDDRVEVDLPGGRLVVEWQGPDERMWMSGPTATVFEGNIDL